MSDLARLTIAIDSTSAKTADKDLDRLTGTGAKAESVLLKMGKALSAMYAAVKFGELARDSAMLAARFETMGVVMNVAGNNAGYTASQMEILEKKLQATGISMLESRNTLTQLATANVDLAQATDLARAAQDLAVVGNMNSSEAFNNLVYGLRSGQVEILRTIGLNVNFENSYKKAAATLGKNAQGLTEQEKMQARVNIALSEASKYAGIYEASMGTAGKQITSMKRYSQDLQVQLGEMFQPVLFSSVKAMTESLKDASHWVKQNRLDLLKLGESADLVAGQVAGLGKTLAVVADNGVESGTALTFVRRTFQGIAGIVAVVTELLNGARVAALGLFADFASQASEYSNLISKVYSKIPGGKASSESAGSAAKWLSEASKAANAKKESILIARSPLESWLDKVEEIEYKTLKAQAHVDKLTKSPASSGVVSQSTAQLKQQLAVIEGLQLEYDKLGKSEYQIQILEIERNKLLTTAQKEEAKRLALAISKKKIEMDQDKERLAMLDARIAKQKELWEQEGEKSWAKVEESSAFNIQNDPEVRYQDALTRLNALKQAGMPTNTAYMNALREIEAQHGDIWAQMSLQVESYADAASSAMADFINGTKGGFRDLAVSILTDMEKMIIKALIMKPIFDDLAKMLNGQKSTSGDWMSAIGSVIAKMFSPAAASGGYRDGSKPYLVGENGPEIFNPGRAGTITPNSAIGGSVVNNVSIVINQDGSSDTKADTSSATDLAKKVKAFVVQELYNQQRVGGALAGGR